MTINLEQGLDEVKNKSEFEIEYTSANSWANKSAASYQLVVESPDMGNKIAWLIMAEDMYHEAKEHSALADDEGSVLRELKEALQPYRDAAVSSILSTVNASRAPENS